MEERISNNISKAMPRTQQYYLGMYFYHDLNKTLLRVPYDLLLGESTFDNVSIIKNKTTTKKEQQPCKKLGFCFLIINVVFFQVFQRSWNRQQ